jgi:hypothetical protein
MPGDRRLLRAAAGAAALLGSAVWLSAEPAFVQQFRIVFGNLHAHTAFSDGSGFPPEAYDFAKDQGGLDFMAITEHHHTRQIKPKDPPGGDTIGTDHSLYDSLRAAAAAKTVPSSFVALFGQEFSTISSGGNHSNVFGINSVIDEDDVAPGAYKQLYEDHLPAHDETLFIQFNHPFDHDTAQSYGLDQFSGNARRLRQKSERWLRTIEVINGPGLNPQPGQKAKVKGESHYKFYLTRGFRLAPVADQDNHHRTWGTLTDARTGCLVESLTEAGLLAAIRARRCYASTDQDLRVWFGVNNRVMGSDIHAATRELTIQYKVEDPSEPNARYRVKIVAGNFKSVDSAEIEDFGQETGDHSGELSFTTPHNSTFIYLRLTQNPQSQNKKDEVLTAPVWIQVP